tara:strand:- start:1128 stop:1433 length:306 start_codon:yes stop_codon:yes gene_type:complete
MKKRDKQNKHKLKFDYITQLQNLGKIWKEQVKLVDSTILKTDINYHEEVINTMNKSKKEEYCLILDKCDDIAFNIRRVDESLKKSHQNFKFYKKIMIKHKD